MYKQLDYDINTSNKPLLGAEAVPSLNNATHKNFCTAHLVLHFLYIYIFKNPVPTAKEKIFTLYTVYHSFILFLH
jgi:hypothetical protein